MFKTFVSLLSAYALYKAGWVGQCVGPTITDTRVCYSHVKLWRHLLSHSLWVLM